MAITGAIYKTLEFDGVSSRDFGVYITGRGTFNAPARDVEMVTIPGRNGTLPLDKGRFENIEVTYPAGIFAETEEEFAEAISEFRNFLCSREGYCRLEDEYNPDEFRMAVYKSGLEVDPAKLKAGQFNIVFDCKPQRWLKEGETAVTIGEAGWGRTVDTSGETVKVDNRGDVLNISEFTVEVKPEGVDIPPSPQNSLVYFPVDRVDLLVSANGQTETYIQDLSDASWGGIWDVLTDRFTNTHAAKFFYGGAYGEEDWKEYPPVGESQGPVYIDIPKTDMDLKTGATTSDVYCNFYASPALSIYQDSDSVRIEIYAGMSVSAWKQFLATHPLVIIYPVETQTTVTLRPLDERLFDAVNSITTRNYGIDRKTQNIVTVKAVQDPSKLYNPTYFESSPLLEVYGYGDISFNGYEISLTGEEVGPVTLSPPFTTNKSSYKLENMKMLSVNDEFEIFPGFSAKLECSVVGGFRSISFSGEAGDIAGEFAEATADGFIVQLDGWGETFTPGTTRTLHFKVQGDITTVAGTTETVEFHCYIVYDGNETFSFYSNTSENPNVKLIRSSYSGGAITADSTRASFGEPAYVDCDLGEAYIIDDGEIISIDSVLDLGSKLPVLAPGTNDVTYDNTVNMLKIAPRWWKI